MLLLLLLLLLPLDPLSLQYRHVRDHAGVHQEHYVGLEYGDLAGEGRQQLAP